MTDDLTNKQDRLKTVLSAYGSKKAHWPAQERNELNATLEATEELQTLYNEEQELDEFLDRHSSEISAPASLMGAVLGNATGLHEKKGMSFKGIIDLFLKPVSGLALAACLGVLIGFSSPNILITSSDSNFDELSLSDTIEDWQLENNNG